MTSNKSSLIIRTVLRFNVASYISGSDRKMEEPAKLGHKIKIISNAFGRIINQSMAEQGLTAAQAFILGYLARNEHMHPCQRDLEEKFHIKHPTANGILSRLQEKGLVDFLPDEYDRRIKRIVITDTGLQHAGKTREKLFKTEQDITRNMTPEDISELNRLLDIMVANTCTDKYRRQKGETKFD